MKTNVMLFELEHDDTVSCVKLVNKKLVSCGDTTVRIWNLADQGS